jgi:hypothetical protein
MIESLSQQPVIWSALLLAIGLVSSLTGGAVSGYLIGGRYLGAEVATQIGGLFGALSGLPGIALALIAFALLA